MLIQLQHRLEKLRQGVEKRELPIHSVVMGGGNDWESETEVPFTEKECADRGERRLFFYT